MSDSPKRKAAARRADVPAAVRRGLNAGTLETANLVEALVVDFAALLKAAAPEAAAHAKRLEPAGVGGITRRMATAGLILHEVYGDAVFDRFAGHPSDTVRGWAAYALAELPGLTVAGRLDRLRPLADDPHFGVREWAWLAVRPHVAADVSAALAALAPWTAEASANLRRFASEATRPRGVWCAHIGSLKDDPEPGLAVLEPLKADGAKYVQDSVANWLNDAAKTRPDWVRAVCRRWRSEGDSAATERICGRALRTVGG